jgi:hypothetical protein
MARHSGNFIRVSPDGWTFQESATGTQFVPLGCNYYDPQTGWPPQVWSRYDRKAVKKHFQMMEDLGLNAIRLWVQWSSFMPSRSAISRKTLDQCYEVLSFAQEAGIRVNLTGPEFWEGCPKWLEREKRDGYQHLISAAYWEAHASFWEQLARHLADNPTVYGYDLVNEPFMPWDNARMRREWNSWLVDRYGTFNALRGAWGKPATRTFIWGTIPPPVNRKIPGSQQLLDYQTFREGLALRWIEQTAQAIRGVDRNHLITVGLHQSGFPAEEIVPSRYTAFNPHLLAKCLDYIALHWYPFGNPYTASILPFDLPSYLEASCATFLANCRYSYAGRPLVMEEFSFYGGGSPQFWGGVLPFRTEREQTEYSRMLITMSLGSLGGWLNWPLQDTPSSVDTSAHGGFYDARGRLKSWGRAFRALAGRLKDRPLRREKPARLIRVTREELLTDGEKCEQVLQECRKMVRMHKMWDFEVS